ncbi:hypothetical protein QYF61_024100 [Mycteria americana]|uniref:CD99 antigen-like protein 2 n=1 Tax=Mycteria americana TaxID=33587 RepID=A0AAN7MPM4_MYCAM|nr:hypothetical protein QYF61_024100 [Mycteria americana]
MAGWSGGSAVRLRLSSGAAGRPFQLHADGGTGGLRQRCKVARAAPAGLCPGDACRKPRAVPTNDGGFNDPFSPATGFDLADYFDTPLETTTKPAKPTPKPFPRPGKPDNSFWDVIRTTTTKQPKTTRAPKHNPAKNPMDLDLADALDDKNDGKDAGRPDVRPGEAFSDDDLAGIVDGGYSPDKNKGAGGGTDSNYGGGRYRWDGTGWVVHVPLPHGTPLSLHPTGGVAETGTIAGIASALAMALIGAVSSYISYQQKKFCFSIQRKSPPSTSPDEGHRG